MHTTDPKHELLPLVNSRDEVIGKITRGVAHQSPAKIHRAAVILIYNKFGKLLIHKRSKTKDTSPGELAGGVAGHVGYGDEYVTCAVRELQEEIGISTTAQNLPFLGKMLIVAPWEKEMTSVFRYDLTELDVLSPNRDEISVISFADKQTVNGLLKKEKWMPSARQVMEKFAFKELG